MKKLYSVLIIVLPIFVGSLAIGDLINFVSGNETTLNLLVIVGLAVVGMATGIVNILRLIK